MKKYLFPIVYILGFVSSFGCMKQNVNVYDARARLNEELPIIQKYVADNNFQYILDSAFNSNGIYYQIINPGVEPDSGTYIYKNRTALRVKYSGKTLNNATNFDQGDSTMLSLSNLISCWQFVIPKIQPKGRVRFISTSVYGYRDQNLGTIPPNSILDFDVEVLEVSEQ